MLEASLFCRSCHFSFTKRNRNRNASWVPVPFLRFRFEFINTWAVGLGEPQQLRTGCRLLLAPQLQRELCHQTVSTSTFKGLLCFVLISYLLLTSDKSSLHFLLLLNSEYRTFKGLLCFTPEFLHNFLPFAHFHKFFLIIISYICLKLKIIFKFYTFKKNCFL